jgi:glycerol-3-phosphate acyltransferase PlsX
MGSSLVEAVERVEQPKVALLNIGEEAVKGNAQVKLAAELIESDERLNFIGYVEGHDLYLGEADVVVCDGFVGNIALKTSEGVARYIQSQVKDAFESSIINKVLGLLASPVLHSIYKRIDPRRLNGASFLGLDGVLVKSHGNADTLAFEAALQYAIDLVNSNAVSELRLRFELQDS